MPVLEYVGNDPIVPIVKVARTRLPAACSRCSRDIDEPVKLKYCPYGGDPDGKNDHTWIDKPELDYVLVWLDGNWKRFPKADFKPFAI